MANGNGNGNGNGHAPIVDVKDVVKSFSVGGSEITILKGISFSVANGEFVSIVGPSGNGKSTLLNMITGIDRPTEGEVRVGGNLVNKMSEDQLARWRGENLGIIFQFFQMLPALSLLNNVILPMDLANRTNSAAQNGTRAPCSCWRWWVWPTRRTSCPRS